MNLGNVMIYGDSYSTFKGWAPEGYRCSYSAEHPYDVKVVEDTWWHQVIRDGNGKLIENNSWSGSTIGYRGYEGADVSQSQSFIYRFREHLKNGFFERNKIDTLFIFGGTNDSWCGAPLGKMMFEGHTEEDLYSVLPAIGYMLKTVTENLPDTRVICLINCDLKEEIMSGMVAAAEHFGVEYVALQNIQKVTGHPDKAGMKQIKEQIFSTIK